MISFITLLSHSRDFTWGSSDWIIAPLLALQVTKLNVRPISTKERNLILKRKPKIYKREKKKLSDPPRALKYLMQCYRNLRHCLSSTKHNVLYGCTFIRNSYITSTVTCRQDGGMFYQTYCEECIAKSISWAGGLGGGGGGGDLR